MNSRIDKCQLKSIAQRCAYTYARAVKKLGEETTNASGDSAGQNGVSPRRFSLERTQFRKKAALPCRTR